MLNRSDQPRILEPEQLVVQRPERIKLPNGVPLSVLNAGDNEVTRIDLLMAGGRWLRPSQHMLWMPLPPSCGASRILFDWYLVISK